MLPARILYSAKVISMPPVMTSTGTPCDSAEDAL